MTTHDAVNHPKHYTSHPSGIECIQITEHMGFNLGNALKYIWRADLKHDADEDLRKAVWYIERELATRAGSRGAKPVPAVAAPADVGWITWAGGPMPVAEGQLVDVAFRSGAVARGLPAGLAVEDKIWAAIVWDHGGVRSDIVAYRISPTSA